MARKPKAGGGRKSRAKADAEGAETEAAKSSEVVRTVSAGKLKSLMASARRMRKDVQEATGTFGQQIKDAIENHHLHRKAFNVIKDADKMEPEKLADFKDMLEHYWEISGLNARAAQVQRLGLEAPGDEDGEDADGQRANVRPFPRQQSVAAE